jgi:hypothetical protein
MVRLIISQTSKSVSLRRSAVVVCHGNAYRLASTQTRTRSSTTQKVFRMSSAQPETNGTAMLPPSHQQTASRRSSMQPFPPLSPAANLAESGTNLPMRHPRPLTAAELHLELEKEQEAIVRSPACESAFESLIPGILGKQTDPRTICSTRTLCLCSLDSIYSIHRPNLHA